MHPQYNFSFKAKVVIDFIKFEYKIPNYEIWRQASNIAIYTNVETSSGSIRTYQKEGREVTVHNGIYRNYELSIIQTDTGRECKYVLKVSGSIHTGVNITDNLFPITLIQLQEEVNTICKDLCINASDCKLSVLEFGVTMPFPVAVFPFLNDNLLFYSKLKERSDFNLKNGKHKIGFQFILTDYTVKIYDTALKHKIRNAHWLKVETRFCKMRGINKMGIRTLQHITNVMNLEKLRRDLLVKWEQVVLAESLNIRRLNKSEQKVYNYFNTRMFLSELSSLPDSTCAYRVKRFQKLIKSKGCGYAFQIEQGIENYIIE